MSQTQAVKQSTILNFTSFTKLRAKYDETASKELYELATKAGVPRGLAKIKADAQTTLIKAVNLAGLWYTPAGVEAKPFYGDDAVLKQVDFSTTGGAQMKAWFATRLVSAIITEAVLNGSFNQNKYYFYLGPSQKGDTHYYSCLPELVKIGNRSSLTIALSDDIALAIAAGRKTPHLAFLEQRAWKPKADVKNFCFAKANYASGFPPEKERRDLWLADIATIFEGMRALHEVQGKDNRIAWVWPASGALKFFEKAEEKAEKTEPVQQTGDNQDGNASY